MNLDGSEKEWLVRVWGDHLLFLFAGDQKIIYASTMPQTKTARLLQIFHMDMYGKYIKLLISL
jgi:hypothetical protein